MKSITIKYRAGKENTNTECPLTGTCPASARSRHRERSPTNSSQSRTQHSKQPPELVTHSQETSHDSTKLEATGSRNTQDSCVPKLSTQPLNDHLQNSSLSQPATPGSSEDGLNHCKLTALNQECNTPNTSQSLSPTARRFDNSTNLEATRHQAMDRVFPKMHLDPPWSALLMLQCMK